MARLGLSYEKPNCRPMHRVQMCLEDEEWGTTTASNEMLLRKVFAVSGEDASTGGSPLRASDFLTQRVQYGDRGRQVKQMVNVRGLPPTYLEKLNLLEEGNVHDPVPGHCPRLSSSGYVSYER